MMYYIFGTIYGAGALTVAVFCDGATYVLAALMAVAAGWFWFWAVRGG